MNHQQTKIGKSDCSGLGVPGTEPEAGKTVEIKQGDFGEPVLVREEWKQSVGSNLGAARPCLAWRS